MACIRSSSDPVVRAYLDQYRVNLLKSPREDFALASVVIERPNGVTFTVASLQDLFGAKPKLVMRTDEVLARQTTQFTVDISAEVGVGILDPILSWWGGAAKGKAAAAYQNARTFTMRVQDGRRDSVDLGSLSRYLAHKTLDPNQRLFEEGDRMYVAVAVVKATTLDVMAKDERGGNLSIDAEATGLASGNGKLHAKALGTHALSYSSTVPLVYGVELMEMDPEDGWHLEGVVEVVQARGDETGTHARTDASDRFPGGSIASGDLFIDL